MTASLLDGKQLANLIKSDIKKTVEKFILSAHRAPALAVILLGEDKASQIYVANKQKACENVGIISQVYHLAAEITEKELINLIDKLNNDKAIDGILVQLPLPKTISTVKIIETIHPNKDVDGFHPYNIGRLAQRNPTLRPCTPMGIMRLMKAYDIQVAGKHAVIVGASNIVGRPMALELLHAAATITVCHRFTTNLKQHVSQADLLIVATGVPDLIDPNWLNSEQVVVDVGIHRKEDGTIRGDLNFAEVVKKVAWLTPVPGGVGPMTIVSLLENTLIAATKSDTADY
ncbi:MAG: bifunctional methylenetetrahydrofolate dehydrogenase/methenyltetrahydrofolate cyclohydrolase [Legionellales bacterium RIFCSPHIGHO2_12_FULL_42_9]|nr:MAG: bifunctional methylenetetrahydrofolate dehydrogenase/methenyltetrahydrofolate cyclohydrolase [Legionellales bacterium RIFCSPHIGHO2_12_FULL_42_9]